MLITHGTDTLEETSYFLILVTKSDKPVVHGRLDAAGDGHQRRRPGNLYNGVAAAIDPAGEGARRAGRA